MTYPTFDRTTPDGATQNGAAVTQSTRDNFQVLRDRITGGGAPGWNYSQTGANPEEPATQSWTDGTRIVRATNNWSGGLLTSITWDYYTGAAWETMPTEGRTYDGSGRLTTGTNVGRFAWLEYLLKKVKDAVATTTAHVAATGAAVHGLGTISTQSAGAVAITGGAINGTPIGATTPSTGNFSTVRSKLVNLGSISGAVSVDWAAGDYFFATLTGNTTFTWSNLPSGVLGAITMEITNPGASTNPFPAGTKWPSGTVPTRTVTGVDLFEFYCRDGATVRGAQAQKDTK